MAEEHNNNNNGSRWPPQTTNQPQPNTGATLGMPRLDLFSRYVHDLQGRVPIIPVLVGRSFSFDENVDLFVLDLLPVRRNLIKLRRRFLILLIYLTQMH
jgi:hypothetical protein